MGPVLLFHARVVIFVVGARAGEANLPFAEVIHQVPVEELAPVIGVKAQDWESQTGFDLSDARCYRRLAAVGHRPRLGPLGMDIGGGNAPAEFPRHALSAMGNGVGFNKARPAYIPVFGADGNLTAQQGPRAGAAAATATERHSARGKQTIDRGRTGCQHSAT